MRFHEIIGEGPALLSADGEELPSVVYHGTRLSAWENGISKEGLKPFEAGDGRANKAWNQPYVFLSWAEYGAARYASNEVAQFEPGEKGVILAITLTPEIARKIKSRLGEFLRCPVAIPTNLIKPVRVLDN